MDNRLRGSEENEEDDGEEERRYRKRKNIGGREGDARMKGQKDDRCLKG